MAPIFSVPVHTLKKAWLVVLGQQPRLEVNVVGEDTLRYELIQRSAIFRFPDRIDAVLVPMGRDRATLAIYSRSTYGYSDLGVNKARVKAWLEALENGLAGK